MAIIGNFIKTVLIILLVLLVCCILIFVIYYQKNSREQAKKNKEFFEKNCAEFDAYYKNLTNKYRNYSNSELSNLLDEWLYYKSSDEQYHFVPYLAPKGHIRFLDAKYIERKTGRDRHIAYTEEEQYYFDHTK